MILAALAGVQEEEHSCSVVAGWWRRGWRMDDGGWRMDDGGWKMEGGGWRVLGLLLWGPVPPPPI